MLATVISAFAMVGLEEAYAAQKGIMFAGVVAAGGTRSEERVATFTDRALIRLHRNNAPVRVRSAENGKRVLWRRVRLPDGNAALMVRAKRPDPARVLVCEQGLVCRAVTIVQVSR